MRFHFDIFCNGCGAPIAALNEDSQNCEHLNLDDYPPNLSLHFYFGEYFMSSHLPDPKTAPELFDSLLTRRVIAYLVDVIIIGLIIGAVSIVGAIFGIITAGVGLIGLVFALPASVVFYYAVTLGSSKRATVGMQLQDIVLTTTRDQPLDGWKVILHPLIFWMTCWILPPFSYFVALFTPRRQMLHDMLTGTLMVRRSPMDRHWRADN